MTKENTYVLATGSLDYQRLTLLSRLYNPGGLHFMKQAGLKAGMKVLEVGCGTGHMAVDLAKIVGAAGMVIASDNSEAQLAIARDTIEQSGFKNVQTLSLDLKSDLPKYQGQFDFIYGRWVIEWNRDAAARILQELYQALKPGGILVYESIDVEDSGVSSYPDRSVLQRYDLLSKKVWEHNHMEFGFIKRAYFLLKEWGAEAVNMGVNQAVLKTAEEKIVMRLGMLSAEAFLKQGIQTDQEFDEVVQDFKTMEESECIAGFFRNFLVSAKRP